MSSKDINKLIKICQLKRQQETPINNWQRFGNVALKVLEGLKNDK